MVALWAGGRRPEDCVAELQRGEPDDIERVLLAYAHLTGHEVSPAMDMPAGVGAFIGRRGDFERLRGIVARSSARCTSDPVIVTIYGQPGTGTSTLAAQFARDARIARRYPGGVLYVDLKGASGAPLEPVAALGGLLRGLGVRSIDLPPDLETLAERYVAELQGRRTVVVLDNAASEAQVRPLLPAGSACLVLITSRNQLEGLPCTTPYRLGVMSEKEAISLLAAAAGSRVSRRQDVEEARCIASLCGFLPLPLSMVGTLLRRATGQTIGGVRSRLDEHRLSALRSGSPDMQASFELSYERLLAPQRTLFRRLRLLPEPDFGIGPAAALLGLGLLDAWEMLNVLVDRRLLRRVGDARYGFHDLLGQFADELLQRDAGPERQAAHERALEYYADQAARRAALLDPSVLELEDAAAPRPEVTLEEQVEALEWLERERPTLILALRQAAQIQAHDVTWRLAASLVLFFEIRGYQSDWAEAQAAALTSARACGDLYAQAWSHLGAGHFRGLAGRLSHAQCHLEEALEMARAGGWPRVQARALFFMGRVQHDREAIPAALERYNRAAAIFSEHDMHAEWASTVLAIAAALHERGELAPDVLLDIGNSLLHSLSQMPETLWTVRMSGRVYECLGHVEAELGALDRAASHADRSREAYGRIGFRHGQGRALRDRGRIRLEQDDPTDACRLLDESTMLFRTTGDRVAEGEALELAEQAFARLGNRVAADLRRQDARAAVPASASRSDDRL